MVNRERPAFVIVHPDSTAGHPLERGRPLREAIAVLARAAMPDPDFGDDMEAVLRSVGEAAGDPWEPC